MKTTHSRTLRIKVGKFSEIIKILYFTEIVGTKEYRKPEWVTEMEHMQEALKGDFYQTGFIFPLLFSTKTPSKNILQIITIACSKIFKNSLYDFFFACHFSKEFFDF